MLYDDIWVDKKQLRAIVLHESRLSLLSLPYFIEIESGAKNLDLLTMKFNSKPSLIAISPDEQFIALASKDQLTFGMIEGTTGLEDIFAPNNQLE